MATCTNLAPFEPYLARAAAMHYALEQSDWYGRTHASEKGRGKRAGISAELARLAHEAAIDMALGELIFRTPNITSNTPLDGRTVFEQRFLRRLSFSFVRAGLLPPDFVSKQKAATNAAHDAWIRARVANDFTLFASHFERVLELARREAAVYGATEEPASMYTALFGTYEPGMTTADLLPVFESVKQGIRSLLMTARERVVIPDPYGGTPLSSQTVIEACRELATSLGFDFQRGGLDATLHPFCSTVSPDDVRLTGNPSHGLTKALLGVAHESGHGLFEQGAPDWLLRHFPHPFRYSLGIHESQSRLWENHVCRSAEFWNYFWPRLYSITRLKPFPSDREQFVASLNQLNLQTIRIRADELTYPLHIIVRFELELDLLGGTLAVNDLPDAFNAKLKDYLGVEPVNLSEGALQDIHWSEGYIGYFPTYLLGSLFAAQLFVAFQRQEPGWQTQLEHGHVSPLLDWLRQNVHAVGHVTDFNLFVQEATGEPLNPQYWLNHVSARYGQPQAVGNRVQ